MKEPIKWEEICKLIPDECTKKNKMCDECDVNYYECTFLRIMINVILNNAERCGRIDKHVTLDCLWCERDCQMSLKSMLSGYQPDLLPKLSPRYK